MNRSASSSPRKRRTARPRRVAGLALLLLAGSFIAIVAACSNQGEGERCEFLNGDDDCKSDEGLACYPAAQLRETVSDRCCPRDRTTATHPVCQTAVDMVGADATTPPDTGPSTSPEASVPDADADVESTDASDADADQ